MAPTFLNKVTRYEEIKYLPLAVQVINRKIQTEASLSVL